MRRFPLLLALAIFLAGCGSGDSAGSGQDVTLALAGKPDAADAGIYLATQRGFDQAEGVPLHPTPVADPVQALTSGRAGMAVLDIHQLALARARGADLVGVMSLVARPVAELRPTA